MFPLGAFPCKSWNIRFLSHRWDNWDGPSAPGVRFSPNRSLPFTAGFAMEFCDDKNGAGCTFGCSIPCCGSHSRQFPIGLSVPPGAGHRTVRAGRRRRRDGASADAEAFRRHGPKLLHRQCRWRRRQYRHAKRRRGTQGRLHDFDHEFEFRRQSEPPRQGPVRSGWGLQPGFDRRGFAQCPGRQPGRSLDIRQRTRRSHQEDAGQIQFWLGRRGDHTTSVRRTVQAFGRNSTSSMFRFRERDQPCSRPLAGTRRWPSRACLRPSL